MTPSVSSVAPSRDNTTLPALRLRFRGPAGALSQDDERALFERTTSNNDAIRVRTRDIIERVRRDGDRALIAMAREFDHAELAALEIPPAVVRRALDAIDADLRRALERAAENIARVHRAFLPRAAETSPESGIVVGRRPDPLGRVGVYAPGGRAVYPSSVLMGAIPARVAGVPDVILASPPGPDGRPAPVLLAAAALAGVDRVFALGGAGAIAAMALSTESVPRVDRIVGPGNAYVAEAKLQLTGVVAIDSPAGPSELLVIADDTSDPEVVARELLAQAEHDPLTCVVAVAVGEAIAVEIERCMSRLIATVARRAIIEEALAGQGGVVTVPSLGHATAFATRYAPEHLLIALGSPERCDAVLRDVRNAGTVFVGTTSSNAFGDYMTGANHVLPTGGLARSYSGLSVLDFIRWTTYQRIDEAAAARLASDVATFAEAEALPGHAHAARAWSGDISDALPEAAPNERIVARADVAALANYAEARDDFDAEPCADDLRIVDLSDNTNLWGTPPAAIAALRDSAAHPARYPSPYSAELKRAFAAYLGADRAAIVTGCGSDDVLDSAMRAFASPGERVAYSTPTFSMIPVFARVNGLEPIGVPLRDASTGYDIDADALLRTRARVIYICAPNNPTATHISREALEHVVLNAPHLVILDEAYAEFVPETNVDLVEKSGRLLVTRTMSKAFGLAGLRIGYGVAAPDLIANVERARGPYKVNAAAEGAALAALQDTSDALGWVREHARLARENRDRFARALQSLGLAPLPSSANFVLVPHAGARELGRALAARGMIVRVMTGLPSDVAAFAAAEGSALRIGVGPWDIMQRVLDALAGALA